MCEARRICLAINKSLATSQLSTVCTVDPRFKSDERPTSRLRRGTVNPLRATRLYPLTHLIIVLALSVLSGCAALTNPVSRGVPAGMVDPLFLAERKDPKDTIPLAYLRRERSEVYRLAAGDILGVFIGGILGEPEESPPVNVVEDGGSTLSLGYPVPVREDGTLALPVVKPIPVDGLTVAEAEQAIIQAYTSGDEPVILPGRERVIVTLVRSRQTRVVVVRQDSPDVGIPIRRPGIIRSSREFRGGAERLLRTGTGTGTVVYLPAEQNDVITAMALTGGLPGLDAANEIVIHRGGMGRAIPGLEPLVTGDKVVLPNFLDITAPPGEIIRIPLRSVPGQPLPFRPEDIELHEGDIVFIEARDTDVFYTGGLLPSGEFPLPRDYDLDVIEAVAQVGGPLINGGINSNNLSGALVASGLGSPSPRLLTVLRQLPNGGRCPIVVDLFKALSDPSENILVRPGDVLILQETKHQAVARYFSQVFDLSLLARFLERGSADGAAIINVP